MGGVEGKPWLRTGQNKSANAHRLREPLPPSPASCDPPPTPKGPGLGTMLRYKEMPGLALGFWGAGGKCSRIGFLDVHTRNLLAPPGGSSV